jgi:cob(I)alamin adenosyltransferase
MLLITYMNRLSDFLFVAARLENLRRNRPEIPW